jgi:hypothetical protein
MQHGTGHGDPRSANTRSVWLAAFLTTFSISAIVGVVVGGVFYPSVGAIQATAIGAIATIACTALGCISSVARYGRAAVAEPTDEDGGSA